MRSGASGSSHVTFFGLGERELGRVECDLSDIGLDLDTTNQRVYERDILSRLLADTMRTRQQKKQTRLSFEPLPSSSPAKDAFSSAIKDRLASVRFEGSKSPRRSNRGIRDAGDDLPTPDPSSQPQGRWSSPLSDAPSTPRKNSNELGSQQEDEDDIVVPSSKRRRLCPEIDLESTPTRKSSRLQTFNTPHSGLSHGRSRSSLGITASFPAHALSIGSPETSGDEDGAIVSRPVTRQRAARTATRDEDPFVVADDDEELVIDSDTRRGESKAQGRTNSRGGGFVVDDDQVEYISSDEDIAPARRRQNGKHKRRSKREQDEIDDDLKDLQTSDIEEEPAHAESRRTRGGPVTTRKDRNREHFEALRRRRAGEKIPRIADSEEEGVNYDFDQDDGADIEEVTQGMPGQFLRLQERDESSSDGEQQHDNATEDVDEDDFVVDDENDRRHGHSGIPLQFTSFASSKPKELFIHIIEWLIKNKIAPAFSRSDELYTLSWNKINDQLKAQAGSRLISSAWNADFKNAILARPEMHVEYISSGDDESYLDCDACNRTNHPARYEFRLGGHPYDQNTLEPIDEDDDEEDDREDDGSENEDGHNDKAGYDEAGHLLPSTDTKFYLGRFCAANAEMGHKLTHWKYHLNQALLAYLEEQGVLSAEAIVAREKLNKKKREKEAENVVDIMQETGVIDEMWRGLQDDLEDARYGMEDHVAKGGKRSKGRIGKVRATNATY